MVCHWVGYFRCWAVSGVRVCGLDTPALLPHCNNGSDKLEKQKLFLLILIVRLTRVRNDGGGGCFFQ